MAEKLRMKGQERGTVSSASFRRSRVLVVLMAVLSLIFAAGGTDAAPGAPGNKPIKATLGTASVGGQWYILGNGMSSILASALPGSSFTVEPSDPIANIPKVRSGEYQLGFGQSPEIFMGVRGEGPFGGKKVTGITAIGNITRTEFITVISKEFADKYGIKTFADIGAKKPPIRITVAARGNITSWLYETIFEQIGFPFDKLEKAGGKVVYQSLTRGIEGMKDRKIDLAGGPIPNPYSGIIDLNNYVPLVAPPMSDQLIAKVNDRWKTTPSVIPKSSYGFFTGDYKTFGVDTILMVYPQMSDDEVYRITKTIYEHWSEIQSIHSSLKNIKRENLPNVGILALHPGAAKFYREVRLIK